MGYIGKTPTPAPLTSSDIAADIINNTHIGDTAISGFDALATAPADTYEFLISDGGVLKRLDASLVGGGGITMAQQWRLSANFTGSQEPITSNLEIADTYGYGTLGSNMTESSGIFSFPSTGYYLIRTDHTINNPGNFERVASMNVFTTTDNSNYNQSVQSCISVTPSGGVNTVQSASSTFIFDVTNTTTHKIQFQVNVISGATVTRGDTNMNETTFTFIRLGDT